MRARQYSYALVSTDEQTTPGDARHPEFLKYRIIKNRGLRHAEKPTRRKDRIEVDGVKFPIQIIMPERGDDEAAPSELNLSDDAEVIAEIGRF
jgi:hypothetical protein